MTSIGQVATGIKLLMINSKRVIAIIPARGGSKGLPGKNIRPLLGKPLLNWTIEAAKNSKFVDQICVTTDSPEIAAVAQESDIDVPFMRPAELAGDTVSSFAVVEHALNFYSNVGQKFDYIVLLEPTSPIRKPTDIDAMLQKLEDLSDNFDAVISVGKVNIDRSLIMKQIGNSLVRIDSGPLLSRRQDWPDEYFPFGVAYISKVNVILYERTFYPQRLTHYVIDRYQHFEIDDIYDFICVEQVMKQKGLG